MYKSFYQLKKKPFEITPDPTFLFPTSRHNEALASLYYGVTSHRGFVVLTGEVGTGKTLIVRSLLGLLQKREVAFALVLNPGLSPFEFIRFIAGDFGLPVVGKAKDEILTVLNTFVLQRHQRGLTTLLVVDEAHHLSSEVLEEVRLLTNLETAQQKLLQIVLAGQPELDQKLDSFELRQLKQRIALRCHLDALGLEECRMYMTRRLEIAGAAPGNGIFADSAVMAVFRQSRGIPRLINTICENALLTGFAKRSPVVTGEMIEDVAKDLRLGVMTSPGDGAAVAADAQLPSNEKRLLLAIRTLLEAHERLKEEDGRLPGSLADRTREHEPYI